MTVSANTAAIFHNLDIAQHKQTCDTHNETNKLRHGVPTEGLVTRFEQTESPQAIKEKLELLLKQHGLDDDYKVTLNESDGEGNKALPVLINEAHLNPHSQGLHGKLASLLLEAYINAETFNSDLLIEGCRSFKGSSHLGFEDTVLRQIPGLIARSTESLSDFFDFLIADSLHYQARARILHYNAFADPMNALQYQAAAQISTARTQQDINMIGRFLLNEASSPTLSQEQRTELIQACNQRMVQKLIELAPGIENQLCNIEVGNEVAGFSFIGFKMVEPEAITQNTGAELTSILHATEQITDDAFNQRNAGIKDSIAKAGPHCFPVKIGLLHKPGVETELKGSGISYIAIEPKDLEDFQKKYVS